MKNNIVFSKISFFGLFSLSTSLLFYVSNIYGSYIDESHNNYETESVDKNDVLFKEFADFHEKEVKLLKKLSNSYIKLYSSLESQETKKKWEQVVNKFSSKKVNNTRQKVDIQNELRHNVLSHLSYQVGEIERYLNQIAKLRNKKNKKNPNLLSPNSKNFDQNLCEIIKLAIQKANDIIAFAKNLCNKAKKYMDLVLEVVPKLLLLESPSEGKVTRLKLLKNKPSSKTPIQLFIIIFLVISSVAVIGYCWPSIWKKIKQYQEKIKEQKTKIKTDTKSKKEKPKRKRRRKQKL